MILVTLHYCNLLSPPTLRVPGNAANMEASTITNVIPSACFSDLYHNIHQNPILILKAPILGLGFDFSTFVRVLESRV